jgi:hypothetical protein
LDWERLVKEKVSTLYGVDIGDTGDLRTWWARNALPTLTTPATDQAEVILRQDIRHMALEQIEWAALKIVAVDTIRESCINKFTEGRTTLDQLDKFCDSAILIIVGSVGRLETMREGDLDLMIMADVGPEVATYYVNQLSEELLPKLVAEANQVLSSVGQGNVRLQFTQFKEEDFRFLTNVELETSSEEHYRKIRANLASGCYVLPTEKALTVNQRASSDPEETIRFQTDERFREAEKVIRGIEVASKSKARADAFKGGYKMVVSGLMIFAAARGLDTNNWRLSYFRLAEILHETNHISTSEWNRIQLAVLCCISYRSSPDKTVGVMADTYYNSLLRFADMVLEMLTHRAMERP